MDQQEQRYEEENVEEQYDRYYDQVAGYDQPPTNWNLSHLTLSQTALRFFDGDPRLMSLTPLVDQICATNLIDDRGRDFYRCLINSQIAEMQLWTDENDDTGFEKLNTARIYLFMLLDGMKEGYRGKLATELRRVYKKEAQEPKKRGIFR